MTNPDTFNDWSTALRAREVIARLVREEMNRQRPPARYGKVYDFNRFTMTCDVLFPGDVEPTRVKMPVNMQPKRRIVADGELFVDVVRVEGVPGNLWVTECINGQVFQDSPVLHRPELRGGAFMHQSVAKYFGGSAGPLPNENEVWFLGRWVNGDSFGADGLAVMDIVIRHAFFTSVTKRYNIAIRSNDSQDTWVKCAPAVDSGPWSGNDFELEMKASEAQVEFRIRRTGWNSGGFTPGGYTFDIWFYGESWEQEFVDTFTAADSAPNKFIGTHSTEGKGPFYSPAMHAPGNAQHLLTGGGAVTYIPSLGILKWTRRFLTMGVGRSHLAPGGYFEIPVPVGGVQIPVYGKSGTDITETVAGGIWLGNWDVLYYELPWGQSGPVGPECNFRIVNFDDGSKKFQVPSHWVLIAVRFADSPAFQGVKIGTGEFIDWSHNLTLEAGFVALGGGWATPSYRAMQGCRAELEGVVKASAAKAAGSIIATLPQHYWPSEPHMYTAKTDTGFGRIDVLQDGKIRLETALALNGWISLDGISFPRGS